MPELLEVRPDDKSCDSLPLTAPLATEPVPDAESAVSNLDQFLTIPKSDKDLVNELRSLGHLIQQHVEDHYHSSSVTQSTSSLSECLTDLGFRSTLIGVPGPDHLASMAVEEETRHVALQHVISRVIFDSISVKMTGNISLLPPSISYLVRDMPPCEKHMGNPQGESFAVSDLMLM